MPLVTGIIEKRAKEKMRWEVGRGEDSGEIATN